MHEGRREHSRDTSVGVDLLEDLVDVRRIRLDPLLGSLLAALGLGSRGLSSLMSGLIEYKVRREKSLPWQEPWMQRQVP